MSEVPMKDVYRRLATLGFADELVASDGHLLNTANGTTIDPTQVRAADTSRFEGSSDPDDLAIVVAVADLEGEPLGVFTAPYGPNASADEAAVLTAMGPAPVSGPPTGAPDTDDHCAAVFPSTETAEVAIDGLRQMGVDDEHIGVAVATGDAVPVEHDDQSSVARDLRWGSGLGAAGGAVGGMALFSLAVPGLGVLGVGGLAAAGIAGGITGSVLGSYLGLSTDKDDVEDHQREATLVLEHGEVLVLAPVYDTPGAVEAALQRHGGRLVQLTEEDLSDVDLSDTDVLDADASDADVSDADVSDAEGP